MASIHVSSLNPYQPICPSTLSPGTVASFCSLNQPKFSLPQGLCTCFPFPLTFARLTLLHYSVPSQMPPLQEALPTIALNIAITCYHKTMFYFLHSPYHPLKLLYLGSFLATFPPHTHTPFCSSSPFTNFLIDIL